jgi:APA family basic amino acid/polyamine antiporter
VTTTDLRRRLGTLDVALLTAGITIGAGIFSTPGVVASHLDSSAWILGAWVLGGAIALTGALIYAELGAAEPEAGGDYVYLGAAFGPLPAFLYGWLFFTISGTGSVAAVAVAAGEYAHELRPGVPGVAVAAGLVLGLTLINVAGLRTGTLVQNGLTAVKLLALVAVAWLAWTAGGDASPLDATRQLAGEAAEAQTHGPIWGLALALVPISFTFLGWNAAGYVGGEVRSPQRILPRGLLLGTAAVTLVYLLLNAAFLRALGPAAMAGDIQVATSACRAALGPRALTLITALVLVSIVGGLNGMILAHARVLFAMARGGHFLGVFGHVHERSRVPVAALLLQGAWALGLLFTGTFARLVGYVTFVMIAMSCLVVIGAVRQRLRAPPSPFRAPGFPLVVAAYLIASGWILVGVIRFAPLDAAIGVGLLIVGSAVFAVWRRAAS